VQLNRKNDYYIKCDSDRQHVYVCRPLHRRRPLSDVAAGSWNAKHRWVT